NHVWAYDFVADRTHEGRAFRMLTVIDEFSRECLAIVVGRRINSNDVLYTLADLFIEPGSPWENGYIESFIGKLRDELLNREIFYTLKEARILIGQWRRHYNGVRPHSSLGYRPPAPETIAFPGMELPSSWSSLETSGGLLH
ncbi:MAG: transposase, partial [Deltaproteobacteria bacterium]